MLGAGEVGHGESPCQGAVGESKVSIFSPILTHLLTCSSSLLSPPIHGKCPQGKRCSTVRAFTLSLFSQSNSSLSYQVFDVLNKMFSIFCPHVLVDFTRNLGWIIVDYHWQWKSQNGFQILVFRQIVFQQMDPMYSFKFPWTSFENALFNKHLLNQHWVLHYLKHYRKPWRRYKTEKDCKSCRQQNTVLRGSQTCVNNKGMKEEGRVRKMNWVWKEQALRLQIGTEMSCFGKTINQRSQNGRPQTEFSPQSCFVWLTQRFKNRRFPV